MAAPVAQAGAGNVETAASSGNVTSQPVDKPANLADNDLLLVATGFQNGATSDHTSAPDGTWVRLSPVISTTDHRGTSLWGKFISSASGEPASYTFSTSAAAGRAGLVAQRVTGVDSADILDLISAWSVDTGGGTELDITGLTTSEDEILVVGVSATNTSAGTAAPTHTAPAGMALGGQATSQPSGGTNASTTVGLYSVAQNTPGASGTKQVGYSTSVTNSRGFLVAIRSTTSGPVPQVLSLRQTLPTDSSVRVMAKVQEAASVRAAVTTDPTFATGHVFGSSQSPDADGYVHSEVSGLNPDTDYYYGYELDSVLYTALFGATHTFPEEGSVRSFPFLAASCHTQGSNDTVFDEMRTRTLSSEQALFFAHLGDRGYPWSRLYWSGPPSLGVAPDDYDLLLEAMEDEYTPARQAQLYRDIPLSYTWSDVDSFGSNSDSTNPSVANSNLAYRAAIPHPTLASSGLYRSWVVGRVRFIQTDHRTFATDNLATDNSSKTLLGATQKAWLLDQLRSDEPVKVWLGDNAWSGNASTGGTKPTTNSDSWSAYTTERAEIGNVISSEGIQVIYVHGDAHSLSADDGSHNAVGGFPIICVAPMDRDANPWPYTSSPWGPPSNGSYPPSPTNPVHAYGWFEVVDDGDTIDITVRGYTSDGTQRVTMAVSFDAHVEGDLAGTLPALTGAVAGESTIVDDIAGTLPALVANLIGDVHEENGTLTIVIGALQGAFAGGGPTSIDAELAGVLPALAGTLFGAGPNAGSIVGTLPALTGAFEGHGETPIGTVDVRGRRVPISEAAFPVRWPPISGP